MNVLFEAFEYSGAPSPDKLCQKVRVVALDESLATVINSNGRLRRVDIGCLMIEYEGKKVKPEEIDGLIRT